MNQENLSRQRLGQYELRELLGVGGMGAVYRAYQASLKREVAVKVMPSVLASQPGYAERFIREAETAAALEHPHIVPIVDYGTVRGTSYIVMRMLSGGTLAGRLAARPDTLPSLGEIAEILKQLASALDYAHGLGVIHRDLKPTNVMFDNQGNAYLVDFGIAKLIGSGAGLTSSGMMIGTPSYMSPEQWHGGEVTPAADQYALGIMAYQLVTGRVPFEAATPPALMYKHLHEMPMPLEVMREGVPEALTSVVYRAIAKEASQRYKSVMEFAQAFGRAIAGLEGVSTSFTTYRLVSRPIKSGVTPGQSPALFRATGPSSTLRVVKSNPLIMGIVALIVMLGGFALLLLGQGMEPVPEVAMGATETNTPANSAPIISILTPDEVTATMDVVAAAQTIMAQQTAQAFIEQVTETARAQSAPNIAGTQTTTSSASTIVAPFTPTYTETATETITPTLLAIEPTTVPIILVLDTDTPTPTLTVTSTATETSTSTPTETEAPSATPEPSETLVPVLRILDTDTPIPTPTETATETPTATSTLTSTPSQTATATNTASPTASETPSATATWTATPTSTWTSTPSQTATATNTASSTATETPSATATWTATPTSTWTSTPSQTATATNTASSTATETPSATATWTSTATSTPSATITPTATQSLTPTVTETPTLTVPAAVASTAISSPDSQLPTLEIVTLRAVVVSSNNTINLRSAPNTNSAVVATARPRQQFLVEEENAGVGPASTWYRIRLEDNSSAWVRGDLVRDATAFEYAWTPVERELNGVAMVLVPSGCFEMGEDGAGGSQCFDEPFWIDKTEVTQTYFELFGGAKAKPNAFVGDSRPVENITWFEAQRFCAIRGGRLLTEAEWEYAARGPNNLRYPWGNAFVVANASYGGTSNRQTANVGEYPSGVSWVGALDMSGNAWEWTSSEYRPYPYDAIDGRESDTGNRANILRILRGGAYNSSGAELRATTRLWSAPDIGDDGYGFRCALDHSQVANGAVSVSEVGSSALTLVPTSVPAPLAVLLPAITATLSPTNTSPLTSAGAILPPVLLPVVATQDAVPIIVVNDGSSVNMRNRPSTGSAIVAIANAGQEFVIEDVETGANPANTWYRVRLENGDNAWIRGDLVRESTVLVSRVNWTPIERDFDGVTMVLVPPGCFEMGSSDGRSDERPVHDQCVERSFWVDKTEVTQTQFEKLGGVKSNPNTFSGANRPVETISWFEARDFCHLRGGRLPTELEWEYAARGPLNSIYPWGNTFVGQNVAYISNARNLTFSVGRNSDGASWVGALDLSGNVWEWTSSLYQAYPYDAQDGREVEPGDSLSGRRVIRGGSFLGDASVLRAAYRGSSNSDTVNLGFGFRCVRDYDDGLTVPASNTMPTEEVALVPTSDVTITSIPVPIWTPTVMPPTQIVGQPEALPTLVMGTESILSAEVIGTNRINLRSGPGTGNSAVMAVDPRTVFVIEQEENGWYRVRFPDDDRSFWVNAGLVRVFTTDIPKPIWTPVEREFGGVAMMLVPAGCFEMGEDGAGGRQCFEEPFWIDKYEVTQSQFAALGGSQAQISQFPGANRPVENITWFEAQDFCGLRASRLPTEAEWEYAARGPGSWYYPWGNKWNENNTVWNRNALQGTADVGSISSGASWVGTLDISGNVWEWASSLYENYPFDVDDGREHTTGSDISALRVLRGGSWFSFDSILLRSSERSGNPPDVRSSLFGFRCVRDYADVR